MRKILEKFPWLEAIGRNVYWRSQTIQHLVSLTRKSQATDASVGGFSIEELMVTLKTMGITESDLIVVHSSMKNLAVCGLDANGIIECFMRHLCPKGTLVCPTFPLYAAEPKGKERLAKDMSNVELVYNVQKSRPWTGELGRALMKTPGARRSLHPLNTIAAYGAAVDKIFEKETIDSLDLPCGPESTWAALAGLNAKIVMLGVDMTHSLTMIHVAEDCHEAQWPVKDWYRDRTFRVIDGSKENRVKVRERHPRWALSYAERKLSRDLYANGIARRVQVASMDVTVLESKLLLDFLNRRKPFGYPYYLTWLSRL